jgi:hypothetical protein
MRKDFFSCSTYTELILLHLEQKSLNKTVADLFKCRYSIVVPVSNFSIRLIRQYISTMIF